MKHGSGILKPRPMSMQVSPVKTKCLYLKFIEFVYMSRERNFLGRIYDIANKYTHRVSIFFIN